jgi:hypothetical protein
MVTAEAYSQLGRATIQQIFYLFVTVFGLFGDPKVGIMALRIWQSGA